MHICKQVSVILINTPLLLSGLLDMERLVQENSQMSEAVSELSKSSVSHAKESV